MGAATRGWRAGRLHVGLTALALLVALPTISACRPPEITAPSRPRRWHRPKPRAKPTVAQILAASELPPEIAKPHADDPMGVTVHRLSNGLTVYVAPDPSMPRVETAIAIRAGSRHDPVDSTGLAHYLEHMMFKGTDELGTVNMEAERPHLETIAALYAELRQTDEAERRAEILADIDRENREAARWAVPNELDRVYAALGIEGVNAFTTDELTAYVATVPNNRLDAWMTLEAERFTDASFRLFWPELEAVYEEKNRAIDSPEDRILQAIRRGLFPQHPYGTNDVLGSVEHLKNPAYLDMADFFQRWYVPNNAAIFLVGDVDADQIVPELEARFSGWRPRRLGLPDGGALFSQRERAQIEVPAPGAESVTLAWRTVPRAHPDAAAVQAMDLLMDNRSTGLLNLELGLPQVVPAVGSWGEQLNEAGYFAVEAVARSGQSLDVVEKLLLAVVGHLRDGKFDEADLDAVVLNETIARRRALENGEARLDLLLDAYVSRRPWPSPLTDVQRLAAVDKAAVVAAANRYLDDRFVSVRRVSGAPTLPEIAKPDITPVPLDVSQRSDFAAEVLAAPAAPIEPAWIGEDDVLLASIGRSELVAGLNRRNDLFALELRWDRGFREAPLLCAAVSMWQISGHHARGDAPARGPAALARKLYGLGSAVDVRCDAEQTVLYVEGIEEHRAETMAVVRAWLRAPTLDEETWLSLRENIYTHRRAQLESPSALARAARDLARYGEHSAWLDQPSNARLARADVGELERELERLRRMRAQVTYFGPAPSERLPETLQAQLEGLHGARDPGAPPRRRFRRRARGVKIFVIDTPTPTAEAILSVSVPLGDRPDDERVAASLYGAYLDGDMSSLLFQEIREARGLAYAVSGDVDTGSRPDDAWVLGGALGTQADKTVEALDLYLRLLRARPARHDDDQADGPGVEARDQGPTIDVDRLEVARATLDNRFRTRRIDARDVPGQVVAWRELGLEIDPRETWWRRVSQLQLDGLTELVEAWTRGPVLVSVVGDLDALDLEGLRALGEVEVVRADDLFGYGEFPSKFSSTR